MPTQTKTTVAIILMALLGMAVGLYLGLRYRPRRSVVEISRRPAPPPERAPAPDGAHEQVAGERQEITGARGSAPPVSPAPAPVPPVKATPPLPRRPAAIEGPKGEKRSPVSPAALARKTGPSTVPRRPAASPRQRATRRPAKPRRLRPVAAMPPERPLPVPRRERQRRIARTLAAARPPLERIDTRPRRPSRARRRARPMPIPTLKPPASVVMIPATGSQPGAGLAGGATLSPAVRALALRRAAQTVRYLERPIVLEGRPATFTTYVVWERGQPRTFSFARQDRRNDLAKIVRVDEISRQVTALVVARGALVQFAAPLDEAVTYNLALQLEPPAPEMLARADELLKAGPTAPAPPRVAVSPHRERVAGMREVVGQVVQVNRKSRQIVLGGSREKTPFRLAEGIELPKVGELISLTTRPDGRDLPRPATSITRLQPTVSGVVTMVRPVAVELRVRTRTPDGRITEIPVPVTREALVFIADQPGDLRALRKGIYIRAYMTPEGETRILGEREAPERMAGEPRGNGERRQR